MPNLLKLIVPLKLAFRPYSVLEVLKEVGLFTGAYVGMTLDVLPSESRSLELKVE